MTPFLLLAQVMLVPAVAVASTYPFRDVARLQNPLNGETIEAWSQLSTLQAMMLMFALLLAIVFIMVFNDMRKTGHYGKAIESQAVLSNTIQQQSRTLESIQADNNRRTTMIETNSTLIKVVHADLLKGNEINESGIRRLTTHVTERTNKAVDEIGSRLTGTQRTVDAVLSALKTRDDERDTDLIRELTEQRAILKNLQEMLAFVHPPSPEVLPPPPAPTPAPVPPLDEKKEEAA